MKTEDARKRFCPFIMSPETGLSRCLGDKCMAWSSEFDEGQCKLITLRRGLL